MSVRWSPGTFIIIDPLFSTMIGNVIAHNAGRIKLFAELPCARKQLNTQAARNVKSPIHGGPKLIARNRWLIRLRAFDKLSQAEQDKVCQTLEGDSDSE